MKDLSLYSLTSQMAQILDRLGEEEDEKAIAQLENWLQLTTESIDRKADDAVAGIKTLENIARSRRDAANALLEQARADERQAERLKQALIEHLRRVNAVRVQGPRFTISVCKAPAKLIAVIDPRDLPEKYQRVTVELDKTAIRADLKREIHVDGCLLEDGGFSLRVKGALSRLTKETEEE